MKPFLFFLFLIAASIGSLFAQRGTEISGRLTDPEGTSVAYAPIVLLNAEDSSRAVVKTAFSAEDGQYALVSLTAGTYILKVDQTGFAAYESDPIAVSAGQKMRMEPIALQLGESALDEVEIAARRPLVEVRPDKTVFNVEGTAISIGEDAFELLRKAPGVMIDNNDNLMLLGKSGVRVYIDGKPSPLSASDLATMLRGMQSDQIESIEIITNPSARYEAEGNAGIINIRLKKDKSLGTNGSVSLGYNIGRFSKYNGSLTFNNRRRNVNLFGNYSGGIGYSYSFTNFLRRQSGLQFDQRTDRFNDYLNNNYKLGVDFYLGEKHVLGVMANGYTNRSEVDNVSITPITELETGESLNTLSALSLNQNENDNINLNINYKFEAGKDHTLNVDADYGRFRLYNDAYQPNFFLKPGTSDTVATNIFAIRTPVEIDIYTFRSDYEQPLWEGKFSAGIRLAHVETDNDFQFYNVVDGEDVLSTDRSNRFIYEENINAAYATFQRKFGKWSAELGLRGEQTNTQGTLFSTQNTGLDTVDRSYFNLFPTAGLTYNLNRNNTLRLNYSRRIDRPRYQDLNPFVNQLDQYAFQRGNPFLLPQYTNSVQLTHTYKYRFNTTLAYSYTTDFFTRITDTLGTRSSFITQENLSSREVISANFSAPYSPTKWWSTYTNTTVSRTRNIGDFNLPGETGKGINIARTTFNIFQQHTFTANPWLAFELSGFYNSPSIWGANYLTRRFWGVNTGARVQFLDKKAMLKLSVSDIFYSMQWAGTQDFGGLFFEARGGWESRQFRVNLTYNFGRDEVRRARRRKTGLDEEAERAGGGGSGPGG